MLLVMTLIAGYTAAARNERRFAGMWISTLLSMGISSWIITAYALLVVLRGIDQWYQPQYAIPLMGMVLGNTLNGISVGLGTLTSELALRRGEIDSALYARRHPLRSGPAHITPSDPPGDDADHQLDDGRRPGEPARHDDRAVALGHFTDRGREVSDHDHVPGRLGDGTRHRWRSGTQLPASLQQ